MQRVLVPSLGATPPAPDAAACLCRRQGETMGTTWSVGMGRAARRHRRGRARRRHPCRAGRRDRADEQLGRNL
ncbi:hypothetical protein ACU4GD_13550 [Cupriavidus basilensis]